MGRIGSDRHCSEQHAHGEPERTMPLDWRMNNSVSSIASSSEIDDRRCDVLPRRGGSDALLLYHNNEHCEGEGDHAASQPVRSV
jgi:hypothetical protein